MDFQHLQKHSPTHTHKNYKKLFIIFICMFLQAIPFGIAQNIQPLFIPYVLKGYGFSLASFSLIFTFGAIASSIFSPFIGKLFGKMNIKVIFLGGAILSGLGFLGFGFAKNLPEFYILSAVCQIGTIAFSGLGIPYLINNWFPKSGKGAALGIAFSGGSIGNVFLQSLTSNLLMTKGYSFAYILFGIISLACSIPVILFFIKLPKAKDLDPEDSADEKDNVQKADEIPMNGPGAKAVRKNKLFWIFGIGYLLVGVAISALSTQYATYFTGSLKFSATLVGSIGSVFAFFCLFGNVVGGELFDKIGTLKTMTIAMVLQIISILALMFCKDMFWLAFLFSIAYGLNVFSYMSAPAFMTQDLFGRKESSEILGLLSLLFAVGFAAGTFLFGLIVDKASFTFGWSSMLVFTVVGYVLLLSTVKILKKQNFAQSK
ncbi:MAG: conjugated bile salt MFS transporter [Sarcina sp.]